MSDDTSNSEDSRSDEWQRLIDEFGTDDEIFEFTREALKSYIDFEIEGWRQSDYEHAEGCVHALQNLRTSFFGDIYPCEICGKTQPHYHEEDADTDQEEQTDE